jgi:acetolactate synthase-1/2/3 large subunit
MNGADALVLASAAAGVDVCFANPGTTEMAMVDAITRSKAMRTVLALFEGVASGAADGYARVSGKTAAVMLHLGPGLGNATANLHNARRSQSPVVNWVGDHSAWLLPYDPPLASDIASIARGTSQWVRTSGTLAQLPFDAVDAIVAAYGPKAGVATLIVPMDVAEASTERIAMPAPVRVGPRPQPIAAETIDAVAKRVREANNPLILLGGHATDERAQIDGARLAEAAGGKLMFERFPRYARRAPGLPSPEKLGYIPVHGRSQLAQHDLVVAIGADAPVLYFGYAGEEPRVTRPDTDVLEPARAGGSVHEALSALCTALDAPPKPKTVAERADHGEPTGALQPQTICQIIARLLPENAVVVDEGITSSLPLYPTLTGAAPHDYIACNGGSIGFGTPVATGAAVAAPDRRVIAYVGDGSAAYTLQSLWTQARENLDVTTIILQNDKYAVLQMELMRSGGALEGPGESLTEITKPNLDFASLARGYGVAAREVRDLAGFTAALKESLATPGPMLIACRFG